MASVKQKQRQLPLDQAMVIKQPQQPL